MKQIILPIRLLVMLSTLFIYACGGGGSGTDESSGTDTTDTTDTTDSGVVQPPVENLAPIARIQFPPEVSLTDQNTITVTGTAEDPEGDEITAVSIFGIDAVSDDGFATWQLDLDLELGENRLVFETEDAQGNTDPTAATVTVFARSLPFLSNPGNGGSTIDAANNRALVIDGALNALFALDLSTGERTVISSRFPLDNFSNQEAVGSGVNMRLPRYLILDSPNNRVLTTDPLIDSLVAIDTNTGERSTFYKENVGGSGTSFNSMRAGLLDAAKNRLLFLDGFLNNVRLLAVDLDTRNRTLLSGSGTGTGPGLHSTNLMQLDAANNRLIVVDNTNDGGAVLAIDLSNGNRQVLSGANIDTDTVIGAGPEIAGPVSMEFDPTTNQALIGDGGSNTVFLVDLDTGERTVVSGIFPKTGGIVGAGPDFIRLTSVNFMDNNQIFAVDDDLETGMIIDITTGNRQLLPNNSIGDGPRLETPRSFALNGERLLVADSEANQVFAIDNSNGDRSVVLDDHNSILNIPHAIEVDAANNRAFIIDSVDTSPRVLTMDLETNALTVISTSGTGSGLDFDRPEAMVFDQTSNRLLVIDSAIPAIFTVDPETGERGLITGPGPGFEQPRGIAINTLDNSLLVMDGGQGVLFSVDADTGERRVISGKNPDTDEVIGDEFNLEDSYSVIFDEANQRAFVANLEGSEIFEVDILTGEQTSLDTLGGTGPDIKEPIDLILGIENNRLLALDSAFRAVFSINLSTGDHVLTSWSEVSPQNNLN